MRSEAGGVDGGGVEIERGGAHRRLGRERRGGGGLVLLANVGDLRGGEPRESLAEVKRLVVAKAKRKARG